MIVAATAAAISATETSAASIKTGTVVTAVKTPGIRRRHVPVIKILPLMSLVNVLTVMHRTCCRTVIHHRRNGVIHWRRDRLIEHSECAHTTGKLPLGKIIATRGTNGMKDEEYHGHQGNYDDQRKHSHQNKWNNHGIHSVEQLDTPACK